MSGRVLTIHLVEGTANGLQTAEIDGWIGKVLVAPRTDLPTLLQQPDLKGLGVYVLVGDDPDQVNKSIIYIGQGQVASRLTHHSSDQSKSFWDNKTLVVVAKDNSLNAADCLYLESRLIELASNAKVSTLTNGQYPSLPHLTAPAKATAENFLAQIQILLPVLNINFFVAPPKLPQPQLAMPQVPQTGQNQVLTPTPSPTFVLSSTTIQAEAELVNNKFVVRQGSMASVSETPGLGAYGSTLRKQLRQDGKLIDDPQSGQWRFSQDVDFSSPSSAAGAIYGYRVSGPQYWKVKGSTKTYDEWQQTQIQLASTVSTTPGQDGR